MRTTNALLRAAAITISFVLTVVSAVPASAALSANDAGATSPSAEPTPIATDSPSADPSVSPSDSPTANPVVTDQPSASPSATPVDSVAPAAEPTPSPSETLLAPSGLLQPMAVLTPTSPTVPTAPTNVTVTASTGSIRVNWGTVANAAGQSITGYRVDYSTDASTWTTAVSSVNALTYTISGLASNSSYYIRVAAVYSGGVGAYGYPWTKVYGTSTSTRDGSGYITYQSGYGLGASDAQATYASTAFSRVRYLMKATYNSAARYVDADFAKALSSANANSRNLTSVTNLRIPSTAGADSQFIVQGNVSDLNVVSNDSNVQIGNAMSGRLELWPWDYGTADGGGFAGRAPGTYDDSDTNTGGSSYGSFQLHNITAGKKQTIFAWNRHGSPAEIGFGDYSGSHSDWTFCANESGCGSRTGFSLETFINAPIQPIRATVPCTQTTTTTGSVTVVKFVGAQGTCSWTPPAGVTKVDALVVGGGGGGGSRHSGGGGGGGVVYARNLVVANGQSLTVKVGDGGLGKTGGYGNGTSGSDSSVLAGANGLTAKGGGAGIYNGSGVSGGSGGGTSSSTTAAGTSTQSATAQKSFAGSSLSAGNNSVDGTSTILSMYGNSGGVGINGSCNTDWCGGGGGGAGSAGAAATTSGSGAGGNGISVNITGAAVIYGGGGGGASGGVGGAGGAGGSGGGGAGGHRAAGTSGADDLGGGGGGGGHTPGLAMTDANANFDGGNGGTGVVILRYTTSPNTSCTDLPVQSDLFACYRAADYEPANKYWPDSSGNNRDISSDLFTASAPSLVTTSANTNGASQSFKAVQGSTTQGLKFPTDVLPANYTLFNIARYNNGTEGRIFDGVTGNWLSGFWNGLAGVAHHNSWLTQSVTDAHGTNWVLSTDQNTLYKSNGYNRTLSSYSAQSRNRISINYGNSGETSAWQTAEVIVFNRELSPTEIYQVEQFLKAKYGLSGYGGQQITPTISLQQASDRGDSNSDLITTGRLTFDVAFSPAITSTSLSASDFVNTGTASCTFGNVVVPATTTTSSATVTATCTTDGTVVVKLAPEAVTNPNLDPSLEAISSPVTYTQETPSCVDLPVQSGLFACYRADEYDAVLKYWKDSSGNNRDVTTDMVTPSGPTVTTTTANTNGSTVSFKTLQGTTSQGLKFPTSVLPSTYTLMHIARYNTGTNRRIFDGTANNFLSGFYFGNTGVAHHSSWTTPNVNNHGMNWVLSTDQKTRYKSNGVNRTSASLGTQLSDRLTLNYGQYLATDSSNWQAAEVIVFDRELTKTEIYAMEQYLKNKYGISSYGGAQITPTITLQPTSDRGTSNSDLDTFGRMTFDVQFTPAIDTTTLTLSDFTTSGSAACSLGNFVVTNSSAATITATCTTSGSLQISMAAEAVTNANLDPSVAVTSAAVNYTQQEATCMDLPITSGLFACYRGDEYDPTLKYWQDSSGNNRDVTSDLFTATAPIAVTTTGNGSTKSFTALQGTTAQGFKFPASVLPSNYTMYHVARYNGTEGRIFDGENLNWLSGFWAGRAGVAYHNGWNTQSSTDTHGTQWVLSSDKKGSYRSNGTVRSTNVGGNVADRLTLNHGYGKRTWNETSDYQVAEVLVFDRELTPSENYEVEKYLANKYGLSGYAGAKIGAATIALQTASDRGDSNSDLNTSGTLTFDVTYPSGVTDLALADFVNTGTAACTFSSLVAVSTSKYTVNAACTTDGTINIKIPADAVTNANGDASAESISSQTINYDAAKPTVVGVCPVGDTNCSDNGTYKIGDEVFVTVKFSEPVTITGSPYLTVLATNARNAAYVSGSGTDTLKFKYVVVASDATSDLNYQTTTSLVLNAGTIRDAMGNDAMLTLPAVTAGTAGSLATNRAIVIDGIAPTTPGAPTVTAVGGTVVAGYINNTNTNLTATSTFTAVSDYRKAQLFIAGVKADEVAITGTSTSVTFNLASDGVIAAASAANLQAFLTSTSAFTVKLVDGAGNISPASTATTPTVDYVSPKPTLTVPQAVLTSTTSTLTVTSTEAAAAGTLTNTDITKTGTGSITLGATTGSGPYTFALTLPTSDRVTNTFALAAGAYTDAAGNPSLASDTTDAAVTAATITYDNKTPYAIAWCPTGSECTAAGTYGVGSTLTFSLKFNEVVNIGQSGTTYPYLDLGSSIKAAYVSGTGTDTLTFSTTIVQGYNSSAINPVGLRWTSGTLPPITDQSGNIQTCDTSAGIACGTALYNIPSSLALTSNRTVKVDTAAPNTPGNPVIAATGGTVVAGYVNGTNTNWTVTSSVTAGDAVTAQLFLGANKIDEVTLASSASSAVFNLVNDGKIASATAANLQAFLTSGGSVTVKLIDSVGNISAASPAVTFATDYVAPTVSISGSATSLLVGGTSTITATVSETLATSSFTAADFAVTGGGTMGVLSSPVGSAPNITYTSVYTPPSGSNTTNSSVTLPAGTFTDIAGNPNTVAPETISMSYDTLAPTVSALCPTGDACSANAYYRAGSTVDITVRFSEVVYVGNVASPTLTLETGTVDGVATYVSGSGTNTLLFRYTVQTGDLSTDLNQQSTTALAATNGATIKDAQGNNAILTLPAVTAGTAGSLATNRAIMIDAVAPTTAGLTASVTGGTVVTASSISAIKLNSTNTTVGLSSAIVAGQATGGYADFWFKPTGGEAVKLGTDSSILAADSNAIISVGTSTSTLQSLFSTNGELYVVLYDAAGNSYQSPSVSLTADYVSPTVTVTASSTKLIAGQTSTITFTTSEATTNFVSTDVGVTGGTLSGFTGSGTSYTATFTPAANSQMNATVSVGANVFTDAVSNNNTAGSITLNLDTLPPTVLSVGSGSTTANGTFGIGDSVLVEVKFSEVVDVVGTPTIDISTTPTARIANYKSGTGTDTLVFEYVVTASDTASALNYASTSALKIPSASIKDVFGNAGNLTLPSPELATPSGTGTAQGSWLGGSGGGNANYYCDAGKVVTGGSFTTGGTYGLTAAAIWCSSLNADGTPNLSTAVKKDYFGTAPNTQNFSCPAGTIGYALRSTAASAGGLIMSTTLGVMCASTPTLDRATATMVGTGTSQGTCDVGNVLTGISVNYGGGIDAIKSICSPYVVSTTNLLGNRNALVVDTTAPNAPGAPVMTKYVGATATANATTLNATNTNATFTASITAGTATGGSAVLKLGTTTIATDATISSSDTSVTFNLNKTTNAELQTVISAGGNLTVQLTDTARNASTSTATAITADYQSPTVTVTSNKASLIRGQTAVLTFTLSEDATDFALGDITATNGTLSSFTGSGKSYTVTFTPSVDVDTSSAISIAANKFTDSLGNPNTASSTTSIAINTVQPKVSSYSVATNGIGTTKAKTGEKVLIEVTTNVVVDVAGTPLIPVTSDGGVVLNAKYVSGSGTTNLKFEYVVQTGDLDTAGGIGIGNIVLNGATISSPAGNSFTTGMPSGQSNAIYIDGVVPTVSISAVAVNDEISLSEKRAGVTISGQIEAGTTATLTLGGKATSGSVVVSGSAWSYQLTTADWSALDTSAGQAFSITATDAAGNTTTRNRTVTFSLAAVPLASMPELREWSDSGLRDHITAIHNLTIGVTLSTSADAPHAAGQIVQLVDAAGQVVGTKVLDSNDVANRNIDFWLGDVSDGTYSYVARTIAGANYLDSDPRTITVDSRVPGAPGNPDLATASDSGFNNDNLTNDNTPTLTIAIDGIKLPPADSGGVEDDIKAGDIIRIFKDGYDLPEITITSDDISNRYVSYTPPTAWNDGSYEFSADARSASTGTLSELSGLLKIRIDTAATGTPSIPDMLAADDKGASNSDNITSVTAPRFSVLTSGMATGDRIDLYDNGSVIGTVTLLDSDVTAGTVVVPLSSALTDGTHTVSATSVDKAGNSANSSGGLQFTINSSVPVTPTVVLDASSDSGITGDSATNDATPTLSGAGSAGDVVVLYKVGTTASIGTATVGNDGKWSYTSATLSEGVTRFTSLAQDSAGNESVVSAELAVTIDLTAPIRPVVTAQITNSATPFVQVAAEAGSTVEVYESATSLGTAIADSSGVAKVQTSSLAGGTHILTATATDAAGNISDLSNSANLEVDLVAPSAPIITVLETYSLKPTLSGTGEANAQLQLFDNGTLVVQVPVDSEGKWTHTYTSDLTDETHVFTAIQTDAAGNISAWSNSETFYQAYIRILTGADSNGSNNNVSITASQWAAIGLDNIDSEARANLMNDIVDARAAANVDTQSELLSLQAVVDLIHILAASDGSPAQLTMAYLNQIGITLTNEDAMVAIRYAIAATANDGTGVDTLAEIQTLVDQTLVSYSAALEVIKNTGNSGAATPALSDYASAGVVGVTTATLTNINSAAAWVDEASLDTAAEVQAVFAIVNKIYRAADAGLTHSDSNDLTAADLVTLSLSTVDTTAEIALLNSVIDQMSPAFASDFQNIVDTANVVERIMAVALDVTVNGRMTSADETYYPYLALTASDFEFLGITGVTSNNLSSVLTELRALKDADLGQIDTFSELQTFIDGAVEKTIANAWNVIKLYDGSNTAPTVTDYYNAGFPEIVNDPTKAASALLNNYSAITSAIAQLSETETSTSTLVTAIIESYQMILDAADGAANKSVTLTAVDLAALNLDLSASTYYESLLNEILDTRTANEVDTWSEVSNLASVADRVMKTANEDVVSPAMTPSEFALIGIAGVTDANISFVNSQIVSVTVADVDTIAELKSVIADAVSAALNNALTVIKNYSGGSTTVPTLSDFDNANVTGVNSQNIGALNALLATMASAQKDSTSEIQAISDAYANLLSGADSNFANNNSAVTLSEYSALGMGLINTEAKKTLADDVIDGSSQTSLDTLAELELVAQAVNAIVLHAAGATPVSALSLQQLSFIGVTGTTAELLPLLVNSIEATNDNGSEVATVEQVQALVDGLLAAQSSSLATISQYGEVDAATPALVDYVNVGVTGVTSSGSLVTNASSNNFATINSAIQALSVNATDSVSEIQAIVDAYKNVLIAADGSSLTTQTVSQSNLTALGLYYATPAAYLGLINEILEVRAVTEVDTYSELSAISAVAQRILVTASGQSPDRALTPADFSLIGISQVANDNIAYVISKLVSVGISNADTFAEIQALVSDTASKVLSDALAVIKNFDGTESKTVPTVATYEEAKVTGVTTGILNSLNSYISGLPATDRDTTSEIQSIVDAYSNLLSGADGRDNDNSDVSIDQFATFGMDLVDTVAKATLANDVIDNSLPADLDSNAELTLISQGVNAILLRAAGVVPNPQLSLEMLTAMGITGTTTELLPLLRKSIDETADNGSGVASVAAIQALLDTLIAAQTTSLDVISHYGEADKATPTLADYLNVGLTGIADSGSGIADSTGNNFDAINTAVFALSIAQTDSIPELQAVIVAYQNVLALGDGVDNDSPALTEANLSALNLNIANPAEYRALFNDIVDVRAVDNVDTWTELKALSDVANRILVTASGQTPDRALSPEDFGLLGLNKASPANISHIISKFIAVGVSGVDTISEITALIDTVSATVLSDALTRIADYVGGDSQLTTTDFLEANVSGITAGNVAAFSSYIAGLPSDSRNSTSEIQDLANAYIHLLVGADGNYANNNSAVTLTEFSTLGMGAINTSSELTLANDVLDGSTSAQVDTLTELQDIAAAVNDVLATAAGSSPNPALDVNDLIALGVINGRAELMPLLIAQIAATDDTGSQVATVANIQDLLDALLNARNTSLAVIKDYTGTNTVPTTDDYVNIGVQGVVRDQSMANASATANNYDAINSAVAALLEVRTDSYAKVQAIVDAYKLVLSASDGTDNNATSLSAIHLKDLGIKASSSAEYISLLNDVLDVRSIGDVDSWTELNTLSEIANRIVVTASDVAPDRALTPADFALIGLTDVSAANISYINSEIGGAAVGDVDTFAEVQALVNSVVESVLTNALDVVANYTGTNTPPSLSIYEEANVSGVTPGILMSLNSYLASLPNPSAARDTTAEIQAIVDAYSNLLAGADGDYANDNSQVTLAQFDLLYMGEVDTNAEAELANDVIDGTVHLDLDTKAELQAIALAVDTLLATASNATANPAITLTTLDVLGVTGGREELLGLIIEQIAATADDGSDLNTVAAIQDIVSSLVDARDISLGIIENYDGTNTAPAVSDYVNIGALNVSAGNLGAINTAIAHLAPMETNSVTEVQAIVDAYRHVLAMADGSAGQQSQLTSNDLTALDLAITNPSQFFGLYQDIIDLRLNGEVNTWTELDQLRLIANRLLLTANGETVDRELSPTDFALIGLPIASDANISYIIAEIKTATISGVDRFSEISTLVTSVADEVLQNALGIISGYEGTPGQVAPTVTDYAEANVEGVTDALIEILNSFISTMPATECDETSEIQAVADALAELIAGADGNALNDNSFVSQTSFDGLGMNSVNTAGERALANDVIDGSVVADLLDSAHLTTIADAVNAIGVYAGGGRPSPDLSLELLAAIHIKGATEELLPLLTNVIANTDDDGSAVDTVLEIQQILDTLIAQQKVAVGVISNYLGSPSQVPVLQDYVSAGVIFRRVISRTETTGLLSASGIRKTYAPVGVSDDMLSSINNFIELLPSNQTDSIAEIQNITDLVIEIYLGADGIDNNNVNLTFEDFQALGFSEITNLDVATAKNDVIDATVLNSLRSEQFPVIQVVLPADQKLTLDVLPPLDIQRAFIDHYAYRVSSDGGATWTDYGSTRIDNKDPVVAPTPEPLPSESESSDPNLVLVTSIKNVSALVETQGSTSTDKMQITGLQNGITYQIKIRAVTVAGPSLPSLPKPGAPVAPVVIKPTPAPTATKKPSPSPTPTPKPTTVEVPLGDSAGLINNKPVETNVTWMDDTTVHVEIPGEVSVKLESHDEQGNPIPASPEGNLVAVAASTILIEGSGMQPGSTMSIYLRSNPVLIDTVKVGPSGSFTSRATIPANMAIGTHTLNLVGTLDSGDLVTLAVGLEVLADAPAAEPSPSPSASESGLASGDVAGTLTDSPLGDLGSQWNNPDIVIGTDTETGLDMIDPSADPVAVAQTAVAAIAVVGAVAAAAAAAAGAAGAAAGAAGSSSSSSGGSGAARRSESGSSSSSSSSSDGSSDEGSVANIDIEHHGYEREHSRWGDALVIWHKRFFTWLDAPSLKATLKSAPYSPLLAKLFNDGAYLRSMLGSLTIGFSIASVALGVTGALGNDGLLLPPSTPILLAIAAIGVFDALAGFVGMLAFSVVMVATATINSTGDVRMLLGTFIIGFAPALITVGFRGIRREPAHDSIEWWERGTDFVVAPFFGGWSVMAMVGTLPALAGLALPIAQDTHKFGAVVAAALFMRVLFEEIAARFYPERLNYLHPTHIPDSSRHQKLFATGVRGAVFVFVAMPFIGNCWQLYVGAVLFIVPNLLGLFGDHLPKPVTLKGYMPSGIPGLAFNLLSSMLIVAWIAKAMGDSENLGKVTFILLPAFAAFLSVVGSWLEEPESGKWYVKGGKQWIYRLGGIAFMFITLKLTGLI